MSRYAFVVERLQGGQPRPYADSLYRYRVGCSFQASTEDPHPLSDAVQREMCMRIAVAVDGRGAVKDEPGRPWYQAFVKDVRQSPSDTSSYEVLIVSPSTH